MELPSNLFDKQSLEKKRARAGKKMSESFLFKEVVSELKERIVDSNRQYHRVAVVTGCTEFWRQHMPEAEVVSDEDILGLKLVEYDLVIHTLCLHWANDPIGQLIQCRRALKADGLFLCALLGGRTLNQLKGSLSIAESRVSGGLSNRFSPMLEISEAGHILQRAGFSLPVADNITLNFSYKSIYNLIRDLGIWVKLTVYQSGKKHFRHQSYSERPIRFIKKTMDRKNLELSQLLRLYSWLVGLQMLVNHNRFPPGLKRHRFQRF